MMRFFEVVVSLLGLIVVVLPIFLIISPVYLFFGVRPIFKSQRVGKLGILFTLYKFRSMHTATPLVASTALIEPKGYMLPFGGFLRRFSIDELPQLWNVLKGDLSLVGPRPSLPTEESLIRQRVKHGIDSLRPGITGYAQVNGRDRISLDEKIGFDLYFLENECLALYIKILFKTLRICLVGSNVSH